MRPVMAKDIRNPNVADGEVFPVLDAKSNIFLLASCTPFSIGFLGVEVIKGWMSKLSTDQLSLSIAFLGKFPSLPILSLDIWIMLNRYLTCLSLHLLWLAGLLYLMLERKFKINVFVLNCLFNGSAENYLLRGKCMKHLVA